MPDMLSAKFSALADPTRRALLARLARGQASVSEIAETVPRSNVAAGCDQASASA